MRESIRSITGNSKESIPLVALAERGIIAVFTIALVVLTPAHGANMMPIAVSGFNRDIVIENTASGPPYNSAALELNPAEGTAFYQSGLPGTTYGLPVSRSFTSATGDGTVFQFQPYTGNNALVLSSETGISSGTLTLLAPNTFSRIAIIANSANATSTDTGTLTLHFTDGSTYVTNYNAYDWFFNSGFALQGVDHINISSGGTDGGPNGDPRFYQTTLNLAGMLGAGNKPLSSLTFGQASGANSTAIYAVSGLPVSAITAPAVSNVPASNIQAKSANVGGQITATGGEAPSVTLYYGATDGGTTPSSWANTVSLGLQGGAFSQLVTGLTPNSTYYFTSEAVNSAGTAWATPSQSFSTLPLTVPTLTNLPATNVQGTLATLNGQILATGGEPPNTTFYYGTTDGANNPAAWAHAVALGVQTAEYAQTVAGLLPNTTYYFNSSASNSAGTSWASPSATFATVATNTPSSAVAVLTHHNDNARTGMNLAETWLNINNVNTNQFGLVFARPVDDQIYAQPLVMTNVNILGHGTRNIVIVVTVNDSVYAFDADDVSASTPYWSRSFINPPNVVPPSNADMSAIGACGGNYQDYSGNIGIVGTPVIDAVAGTVYLVARTKENGNSFVQRLHALDVATGAERANSPVAISATFPGTGDGSSGGIVTFDSQRQNQRPALVLAVGIIYISWSSHCDNGPYHGWVIGYDQTTLQQVAVYNDTPNGSNGGIWMSGQGPAADASGNLYLSTGNGTVDTSGTVNRGESFLKLTKSGNNLNVASWFTPYDYPNLESFDLDLGSGGMLLIPGTTLAFSGGKEGFVYLVNRDNMGGLTGSTTTNNNIIQYFRVTTDEVHGGPIWWDGPGSSYCYVWPSSVHLQQYVFNRGTGKFNLPATAQGPTAAPTGQPGGLLALSANGTNAGSGIIWAVHQLTGDANQSVRPGILHAYNAQNVATELWNSEQASARDSVGNFAKFVPPTVANGKVYLATFSGMLKVYGLLPATNAQIAVTPPVLNFGTVAAGTNAQANFVVTNQGGATLTNGTATVTAGPFTILSGTPFTLPPSGSTNVVVRFTPGSAGNFTNTVTFTSGNGGNSTNTATGTGAVIPAASFTGAPTSGLKPLNVTFTDTSTGTITNRSWTFGDGATSNTVVTGVTHTYALAGTNTVALTVTGPVGTNTLTRTNYIVVTNPPPLLLVSPANLTFGTLIIGQTNTQSFQVVNSGGLTLTGGVVTTPPFRIQSGSPFSLAPGLTGMVQVAFSPSSAGSFSNLVTFTSNGGNATNSATGAGVAPPSLAVSPASLNFGTVAVGTNPQANFVVTNQGGATLTNGTATVTAGPFTILSGTPFNLSGNSSTNLVIQFTPTSTGNFTNTITFNTANAGNATNTVTGTGAQVPRADFSAVPTSGAWPLTVSFNDGSTGTITNRFWDFGNGSTSNTTVTSLSYTYGTAATNTVVLTVSGPLGSNSLTRANYIVVTNPGPVTLTIARSGADVQLTWSDGTLQSAIVVTGPYTNVTDAISPYSLPPAEATRFFRVKVR
jgi:PKD repeat protein